MEIKRILSLFLAVFGHRDDIVFNKKRSLMSKKLWTVLLVAIFLVTAVFCVMSVSAAGPTAVNWDSTKVHSGVAVNWDSVHGLGQRLAVNWDSVKVAHVNWDS